MFEQYKEAIESSNIISKTDTHGIITFVNDEFCKISGYSYEELMGSDHNIVRHPDVPNETFSKLWETILDKKTYKSTVKNLAKDGSTFYVNTTITPILDKRGYIEEFIAIRYDVTEEVNLKLELEQKEKELKTLNQTLEERVAEQTKELKQLNKNLEKRIAKEILKNSEKQKILFAQSRFASLGQMIANIAHQWRQPLTELNLSIYSFKEALNQKNPEEVEKLYRHSKETIQSMSKTIEDFQNFFNPNKSKEPFSPVDSIKDALSLLKKALKKEKILIRTSLNKQVELMGISSELTQVILNLLQNSRDALGEVDHDREIEIDLYQEDSYIVISVQDNGAGINKGMHEKIFEPYFSTKHASKGTGLGLFMSRMIIQQSLSGSLEAHNSQKGALFVIKIPISKEVKNAM